MTTPKLTSIPEILAMEKGLPITSFRGFVTQQFPRKNGTNAKGPWSFETLIIKSEKSDASIRVTLKMRPPAGNLKGKVVLLEAKRSDKHGWVGLRRETEVYNEEERDVVIVTGSASIKVISGGSAEGGSGASGGTRARPTSALEGRQLVFQLSQLAGMAFRAAHFQSRMLKAKEILTTTEDVRCMATMIMIGARDAGVHLTMPKTAEEAGLPKTPPASEEPPAEDETEEEMPPEETEEPASEETEEPDAGGLPWE